MADEGASGDSEFLIFLRGIPLEDFYEMFVKSGVTKTENLEDVDENDAQGFGMSKFQAKRLTREFTAWKVRNSSKQETSTNQLAYRVSNNSVVIPLHGGMRNFLKTRDGQGNIVVSATKLQEKFKQLWYKTPQNPAQELSNTFILQMAEYRLQFEKKLRSCELWCRNRRSERIEYLLSCAHPSVVAKWTSYYKKKSVEGLLQLTKQRFPEVEKLVLHYEKEKNLHVPRALYDSMEKVLKRRKR